MWSLKALLKTDLVSAQLTLVLTFDYQSLINVDFASASALDSSMVLGTVGFKPIRLPRRLLAYGTYMKDRGIFCAGGLHFEMLSQV